jgi:methionine-S-sulfoxide reductase
MGDEQFLQKATLAGGCFWCMQPPFDALDGVIATVSGYAGGKEKNPTYQQVCAGDTGHAEVIQVTFDTRKVSYREILDVYWRQIDPTTTDRQFVDSGRQYRTAIFYHDDEQRRIAEASKKALEESGIFSAPIVTEIKPLEAFYPAEEYHQDYYRQNPLHYKLYRSNSGRDHFLQRTWGKKRDD